MKINKILTEDVEKVDDMVIDPNENASEIADDVQDQVEAGSEGAETVSDSKADAIAQEIVQAGDDIGAGSAFVVPKSINTDNKITRLLEKAFKLSIRNRKMGMKENCNILLIGLPGSAKTASVYDWAAAKGDDVNLVYVNAKNNDLESYINGYTVRDDDDRSYVRQAYSRNLSDLENKNSVLFLDEYNRQVKPHIRASLLTLINEHYIVGNDKDENGKSTGKHYFPNLLFTIACINPAVPTDKGAAPLNDAELSRFAAILDNLDSDPASAADYLNKRFDLLIAGLNPKDAEYAEFLEIYLRIQDLGLFIVQHEDFSYDTKADLDDLSMEQKKMLNQRSLGEILVHSGGDVNDFKDWVEMFSHFLQKDKDMLLGIADEYVVPSFEELCRKKGIDPTNISNAGNAITDAAKAKAAQEILGKEAEDTGAEDIEDDEDFFSTAPNGPSGAKVKSAVEVVDAIKKAAANW